MTRNTSHLQFQAFSAFDDQAPESTRLLLELVSSNLFFSSEYKQCARAHVSRYRECAQQSKRDVRTLAKIEEALYWRHFN